MKARGVLVIVEWRRSRRGGRFDRRLHRCFRRRRLLNTGRPTGSLGIGYDFLYELQRKSL